jgi:hypothetical protein
LSWRTALVGEQADHLGELERWGGAVVGVHQDEPADPAGVIQGDGPMAARIGTAHRDIVTMIIGLVHDTSAVLWADTAPDPETRPADPLPLVPFSVRQISEIHAPIGLPT